MSFIIKGGGVVINTSMAGNVQPVVNSFEPLQLGSKLTFWLDEREHGGNPITSWGDQSSYGTHDLTNAGSAGAYTGYTINGYEAPHFVRVLPFWGTPTIFDGSTWNLGNIISSSSYHAFAVVNIANINTDWGPAPQNEGICSIGSGGAWAPFTFKSNGGNPQLTCGHYQAGVPPYNPPLVPAYKTITLDGLTLNTNLLLEMWYDGTNIHACIATGSISSLAAYIVQGDLSVLQLRFGHNGMSGSIGSVLICNQALDEADRAKVRQYLGTKYGVAY